MIAAVALHLLAAAFLLSYEPARTALLEAAPIMVELITPPKPEKIQPPQAKPVPAVKPVPVVQPKPVLRPIEPALIVAAAEAPSPVVAPPPPPPGAAPVIAAPVIASAPVIQAAAPAPVPITPPIFNAAYLENPAPPYPPQSQRMGEQGRVTLRVLVTVGGRADTVQVRTSSGSRRLDDSALETVRKWRFEPAKRGDQAVADWVLIPINFVWARI